MKRESEGDASQQEGGEKSQSPESRIILTPGTGCQMQWVLS